MSAVAVVWRFDGNPRAGDDIGRMLNALAVYGPDRKNWTEAGGVALGQCLGAVLPEDRFDRQPLQGKDGSILVADCRLDNRDELTGSLAIDARELADSAILLAVWERWGEDCLERLIGDFAFAVWDAGHRRLFCARDPLGMRPLSFHRSAHFAAIASMPPGLFALAEVPRTLDATGLADHLALLAPAGTRSFYRGIERLPPGHCLTITADGQTLRRYWRPDIGRRLRLRSDAEYTEALRAQLDQAVHCRLRAAGPIGSQLSGGLDSGAVTAIAARWLGRESKRLTAFTAVPRDPAHIAPSRNRFTDEGPYAAAVAARYPNIDHVLIRNAGQSPLTALTRTNLYCARPVLNACNQIWLDAIEAAAQARSVRALLVGNIGNLTASFDGLQLLPVLLRSLRIGRWLAEARGLAKSPGWRWRGVLAASIGPFVPALLWHTIQRLAGDDTLDLANYSALRTGWRNRVAKRAAAYAAPRFDSRTLRLDALARIDSGEYFAGAFASHGVDYRDPFTDKRLVEFTLAVPDEQFLKNGVTRSLMRRAVAGMLPDDVANERRKGLQAADWYENVTATRDVIAAEIVRLKASPTARACIDLERLRQLIADWPEGDWQKPATVAAYRLALLRGVATGNFIRYVEGGND